MIPYLSLSSTRLEDMGWTIWGTWASQMHEYTDLWNCAIGNYQCCPCRQQLSIFCIHQYFCRVMVSDDTHWLLCSYHHYAVFTSIVILFFPNSLFSLVLFPLERRSPLGRWDTAWEVSMNKGRGEPEEISKWYKLWSQLTNSMNYNVPWRPPE